MDEKTDVLKTVLAWLGAFVIYLVGGVDKAFLGLLILIVVDYITGFAAAYILCKLNSIRGFRGIVKKLCLLLMVVLAHQIDFVFNMHDTLRAMVVYFLLANEGLSIIENFGKIGVKVPNPLKKRLEQLTEAENIAEKDKN